MTSSFRRLCVALCALASLALTVPVLAQAPAHHSDASAATPKAGNKHFFEAHDAFLARGKAGPMDLLFLGDSITENWSKAPEVWKAAYSKYNPANFGIGGDRTQHVIWRIENGELDGIHPKVVVLMLGTNNSADNTADEIFAADRKIVGMIQSKIPGVKVLLLAIFPRGPRKSGEVVDTGVERMKVISQVNAKLATLDNGTTVRYLDIGSKFLGTDGKIPNDIMPDQLHPNVAGYKIWVAAMQPLLTEMMGY